MDGLGGRRASSTPETAGSGGGTGLALGRVFSCRSGEDYCAKTRVVPTSGTRARDLFWQWPASIAAGVPQAARPR
jgi:hypothetical protein